MKVCYFGTYSTGPGYPRNRVIIKGLRENRVEVVECHKEIWKDAGEKIRAASGFSYILKIFFRFLYAYLFLTIKFFQIKRCDLIIIGYAGHLDVFIAKILNIFRRKPIIFDAFLSLYDTVAMDRKLTVPDSLKAKILRMIDRHSCMVADVVLLDTNEHIEYFVREFGLPREKFIRVFVGEDDSIFKHETILSHIPNNNPIKVLFFGTYIPLHGIDYILKAAEILKDNNDIIFSMIGNGPLLENTLSISNSMKLKNIQFITRWINYDKLPEYIREADICLGIFGDTEKARRVIPCKVYDCIALGKPLITGDSPAVRELLTDGEDVIFCEMANPEDLAKSILTLRNDYNLRKKIGENAYNTYTSFASPKVIGENLVNNLKPLISREYKG